MTQPANAAIRRSVFNRALLAATALIAAAAVRLANINCQLWLDEIWSIRLSQKVRSPLGILFLHHDNNHWLNTLALYFIGPGRPWWMYHLLPEAAGIATVFLGWLIARRRGGGAGGMAALILLAGSEFLIEFSSDARGYAPAGFFALLSVWLLDQYVTRPRRRTVVLMAISASLGILSHLTFVVILAGLAGASMIALAPRCRRIAALAHAVLWWAVPGAILIILYFVDIRGMVRGGGPARTSAFPAQAAAMILGLPSGPVIAPLIGIGVIIVCFLQLRRLYRAADVLWPVGLVALLMVPIVLFCIPSTEYVHPRYLYVAVPFIFILCGLEIGQWLTRPGTARAAGGLILIAFIAANMAPIINFLYLGRGDPLDAVKFILNQTAGREVILGTDRHITSTMMVFEYYNQYHARSAHLVMSLDVDTGPDQWPQWWIAEENYGPDFYSVTARPFVRRADFPKGAVTSGIPWTIYESATSDARARVENLQTLAH